MAPVIERSGRTTEAMTITMIAAPTRAPRMARTNTMLIDV